MISDSMYHAIKFSWLGVFMRGEKWAFATGEALHFIGLSLLLGSMLIVDLRLLGFLKAIPYRTAFKFLPIALFGFAINVVTGAMFIATEPRNYGTNPDFWVKMGLVALAGLNALWFTLVEHRRVKHLADDAPTDVPTRVAAFLSLAIWFGVILAGRLLPTFSAPSQGG